MKIPFIIFPLALLTACATPQQRCINTASNTVNRLQSSIQTAHDNIVRGYAIHSSRESYEVAEICYDGYKKPYTCYSTEYRTVENPVSIDVVQERRKLAEMERRLIAARRRMNEDIAICRTQYPS